MFPSVLICAVGAAIAVFAAPGGTPFQVAEPYGTVSKWVPDADRKGDYFIPTTNMPMTNVFQGFMDECADGCRLSAVCLAFPWAYQTCFDIHTPTMSFSNDHLNLDRLQCEIQLPKSQRKAVCPDDQVCLPRVWPPRDKYSSLEGWCIQKNVYQMNYDAFCKGRYQKADGVWGSDMRGGKQPAMYLGKPAWRPSAAFDQKFDIVNQGSMPPACQDPLPY